jgi:L-lactate dehydrogenase complex protein LldF
MSETAKIFLEKSTIKTADKEHGRKIHHNIDKYNQSVKAGRTQFSNLTLARQRAKNIKWRAIETLDQQLEQFELNFRRRGGKVLWAENAEQAVASILKICDEKGCRQVVKSKSMATEEIKLNEALEKHGIESVETDLGEYIQQLDGEPPYHIVTPAMHKSKEDVAKLFSEKLGTPPNLSPAELTMVARKILRDKYTEAQVGITGANFIISETGSIAITENEGNARLCLTFPKTHIVIVGIEKVIPSIQDLSLFWPLLSTFGTGQIMTVYNSIISGPRQPGEKDGPEEMIVILLDNGRTNVLKDERQRESLYCIRCGACLNACPVYKNIGGHAYGTTYSGPIGSIITPNMHGMKEFKHLSFASSLCGNCTEVCPMKINLHELLLENRKESVESGTAAFTEKIAWKLWKMAMMNRGLMNKANAKLKNKIADKALTAWTAGRGELLFGEKSFNQIWKERKKTGSRP